MAENQKNPEKQPQQPLTGPEKKLPPLDEASRAVLGKFEEKEAENVKQVDEMFEKRISGSKLAEVALNEVRTMKENQKKVIHETFDQFKKQYREQSEQNKAERDMLAQKLLTEAESEAQFRILNIQLVLDSLVKGDYITEEEAAELKRVLVGVEKISMKDVETQQILRKLKEHKEINAEDYNHIVGMIDKFDFATKDASPQKRFEITTAGILVGFMKPAQRYKLVEEMMDSSKREQTAELIDGFLKSGILTVAQGEALFQEAIKKKLISEQDFNQTYEKQLHNGFYVDEVKKVRQALNKEVEHMKGVYSDNIMNRIVGSPLLGLGMALHSLFWILTNVLASGGDFKTLFTKNPYIWAAIGEGTLGVEMASGSMKKGSGNFGIGSGWVSGALEKWTQKEGPKTTAEKSAFKNIADIDLNYPDLGSYLENGGAATIINLRKAKIGKGQKGQELLISFDELMKAETNGNQQSRLANAQKNFPQQIIVQVNTVAEAMRVLKFETQDDYNSKIADVRQYQGLATAPVLPPQVKKVVSS